MPVFSEKLLEAAARAEARVQPAFDRIDQIALANTARVMDAFQAFRVSDSYFAGTTGYGYDDAGREALDGIYAKVFGAESALVRVQFVNGTHAIAAALYGALEPGQTLVCATGMPYDTIQGIIGFHGAVPGNLKAYGISAVAVPLQNGQPDAAAIEAAVSRPNVGAALLQRSRGYASRGAFSAAQLGALIERIHAVNPRCVTIVDNCYGEFVDETEPTAYGADLMAGSLIKNPGGGLAVTGGYVAGKAEWVERAAYRLTVPGIGGECGSTLGQNRSLFQGFFQAPHTVAQALKTAHFAAALMEDLGFRVDPAAEEERHDIIQTLEFGSPEPLLAFMRGIQAASPVDAFVEPVPAPMPGYEDKVVMAAGTFVQGATSELSADAPMRAPYTAFMQGGLTYESGKLGILMAARNILEA